MQDFILNELSGVNFEEKVQDICAFLDTKREPNIVFVGVGKTAYVAKRLCASFISMSIKCRYLHAADALHGDMGLVGSGDQCVLFSYSGETSEILAVAGHLRSRNCSLLSVTNSRGSALEGLVDKSIFLNYTLKILCCNKQDRNKEITL